MLNSKTIFNIFSEKKHLKSNKNDQDTQNFVYFSTTFANLIILLTKKIMEIGVDIL